MSICGYCLNDCTPVVRKEHTKRNQAVTAWTARVICKEGDRIMRRFANPLATPSGELRKLDVPESSFGHLYNQAGQVVGVFMHERNDQAPEAPPPAMDIAWRKPTANDDAAASYRHVMAEDGKEVQTYEEILADAERDKWARDPEGMQARAREEHLRQLAADEALQRARTGRKREANPQVRGLRSSPRRHLGKPEEFYAVCQDGTHKHPEPFTSLHDASVWAKWNCICPSGIHEFKTALVNA